MTSRHNIARKLIVTHHNNDAVVDAASDPFSLGGVAAAVVSSGVVAAAVVAASVVAAAVAAAAVVSGVAAVVTAV